MNLEEFIASPYRNLWIEEPGLSYYVRKSIFFVGSIELASCHAIPGEPFGFWRFLKRYENRIPFVAEQVLNDDIAAYLRRRGWRERYVGPIPQFASPLMCQRYGDTPGFQRLYGDARPK